MSTSKNNHDLIMQKIYPLGASSRAMMGEYVVYFNGKVVGGIYDNKLLIKNISSAQNFLPSAPLIIPYAGAKPMIFVENLDDSQFMLNLFESMFNELPTPKPKKVSKN